MTITVTATEFVDVPGMPHVHTDARRIITENVTELSSGMLDRVTRIEVTGTDVQLGNHFHDFDEQFAGTGGGTLYTASANDPADIIISHDLPEDGWEVTVPAGTVHTFALSVGAILVSRTDRHFVSDNNRDEHPDQPINTHAVRLEV